MARQRLRNQGLARPEAATPADIVSHLCAVQAQDYAGAKWALGLRARGLSDAAVDEAFDAGSILRTHVLRPTWHFVAPADIRWMLALTAPRVRAKSAYYDRQHGVDGSSLRRSRVALGGALRDGKSLTRTELAVELQRAGVRASGPRLAHLLLHAELDGLVCSGPRRGKQFTYVLLEDRVPRAKALDRDEALSELARRYFESHGPATLRDYVWWSGLSPRDARAGIAMAESLAHAVVDGQGLWFVPSRAARRALSPSVHLLPNYDEYVIAYQDRGALLEASGPPRRRPLDAYAHLLLIDGKLRGTWRRRLGASTAVEVRLYRPLSRSEQASLAAASRRYARFVGTPVAVSLS